MISVGSALLASKPHLCNQLALWPWESYMFSLDLLGSLRPYWIINSSNLFQESIKKKKKKKKL